METVLTVDITESLRKAAFSITLHKVVENL